MDSGTASAGQGDRQSESNSDPLPCRACKKDGEEQTALEGLDFSSPNTIARYYMEDMRHRQKEVMKLLLLNTKAKLIGASDISVGTVNATLVSPEGAFS